MSLLEFKEKQTQLIKSIKDILQTELKLEGGLDPTGHQSMKENVDTVINLKMSFIFY